ncbi:hypothetical protein R3P38DRAFT_610549 [Favolaschia claudopus]|uniref:NADH dehydrogenase subunit 6 n=1 Tax=Favolaschia claudopus TaxID=2862362 RepID=A0AAW0CAK5_9AGAR
MFTSLHEPYFLSLSTSILFSLFVPRLAIPHRFAFPMSGTTSEFEPASLIAPIPIIIFDVVAVVASLSLALILAPALLSPTVKRSKTWFTMITAMMIFPTLYLLNVRSQFDTGNAPPIGPCIVQAGFIYAGIALLCSLPTRASPLTLFQDLQRNVMTSPSRMNSSIASGAP